MDKSVLFLVVLIGIWSDVRCKGCHKHIKEVKLDAIEQWVQLTRANISCVRRIETEKYPSSGLHCNTTFDGVMCWPFTPAGTTAVLPCPNYINKFNILAHATRECLPTGEWYVDETTNKTWTDYTTCHDPVEPSLILEHMPKIRILYNVGYAISLASLLTAVILMLKLKKLHCQRNTIHINLFISFILRSIVCFVKDAVDVPPGDVVYEDSDAVYRPQGSNWGCKLVYALFQYSLTANYMWIFVESLYLHTLIFFAMFQHKKMIKVYIVIGWCSPLLCVIPWLIVRILLEDTMCWNTHDQDKGYYWIIKGPIVATIIVNFFFFINIIRVLFTKLTAVNTRDPKTYRKLAKSTLVLIPLFGVYYMVFVGIPDCLEDTFQIIRVYTEMVFNSFQGFVVALLFCFLNGEVKAEIHKKWKRQLLRRRSVASTRVSFSIGSSFLAKDRSPSIAMNDCISKDPGGHNGLLSYGFKKQNDDVVSVPNGHIKSTEKTVKYTKVKEPEFGSTGDDITQPMLRSSDAENT